MPWNEDFSSGSKCGKPTAKDVKCMSLWHNVVILEVYFLPQKTDSAYCYLFIAFVFLAFISWLFLQASLHNGESPLNSNSAICHLKYFINAWLSYPGEHRKPGLQLPVPVFVDRRPSCWPLQLLWAFVRKFYCFLLLFPTVFFHMYSYVPRHDEASNTFLLCCIQGHVRLAFWVPEWDTR